ncbi:BCCT family transporter [Allobacillus sp. GCM10007491]|uniref:BCCT family transporter n=2 Tax=Allobacillus TaxID=1400133 RepID=A0A941CTY2_9BACI|nr:MULTISPECIES: BCCT family transporter [Allobacillus]MBR7553888.1 BCCT family transporter [Allobacillus saliphilus]MBR7554832.1 BCCT family transporter [Allobacillus saliphilus]TSJ65235.1 BCCT family transporter [Allobacillus salarius]
MNLNDLLKNPVFFISAFVVGLLAILGAIMPNQFASVSETLYGFTTTYFGWFYLIAVFMFTAFLLVLAITRFGKIRLGGENERPEFPFFTWIGMLFSAGLGVGLVFWGVAEPMSHYFESPFPDIEDHSVESARVGMGYSFFHWGMNQWSIFTLVGLIIAYLQYRKKRDGLVSTALEPITGNNANIKTTVDSLAVIATVIGIATSIGLGVLQMNGGLNAVFGIPNNGWIQILIIVLIFIAYMISSTTGLHKGIKYLSNVNMSLIVLLLLFVFITGPTVFILNSFVLGLGDYITNIIQYSLRLTPYEGGTWVRDWTIFYWAWVIAWSPFVGAFIARVSRGRTIREFIFGVMIVPPLISLFWFATFGGTALHSDLKNGTNIAEAVNADVTVALFEMLQILPLPTLSSLLAILLVATFLITSADSAAYILGSMTTKGSLTPPMRVKMIWGVLLAAIAGVLLFAGGLEALQTASLIAALPFALIMLLMIAALIKLLRKDVVPISKRELRRYKRMQDRLEQLEEDKDNQPKS